MRTLNKDILLLIQFLNDRDLLKTLKPKCIVGHDQQTVVRIMLANFTKLRRTKKGGGVLLNIRLYF